MINQITNSKYWPWLKYGSVLVLALVSFAFGRFSSVAETKTEYIEKEKIVYQDRLVEKVIEKKGEVRVVYVEKTKVTKPDGTVEEKETSKEESKTDTEKNTDKTTEKLVYVDREVIKREEVRLQPRFYLGAVVGYSTSPGLLPIPTAPNLTLGIEAKIRVVGPVYLGAIATNTGMFAGTVGVTF